MRILTKQQYAETLTYADTVCCQCGRPNHPYMVTDRLWKRIVKAGEHFLCLLCFEARLGRSLVEKDFTPYPINLGIFGFHCAIWAMLGEKDKA